MDGYAESGNPAAALRFGDDTMETLQTVVGVEARKHVDTFFGWVRPYVGASWWHSFDMSNSTSVALAQPGFLNGFQVDVSEENEDRAVVQSGLTIGLDEVKELVIHLGYQAGVGTDGYLSHTGTAGLRVGF
jgi:outer membrane autotransporter protein